MSQRLSRKMQRQKHECWSCGGPNGLEWGTPKTKHVPCGMFICEKCIDDSVESFREALKSIPAAEMVPVASEEMINEEVFGEILKVGGTYTCRNGALVRVGLSWRAYIEWFFADRRRRRVP